MKGIGYWYLLELSAIGLGHRFSCLTVAICYTPRPYIILWSVRGLFNKYWGLLYSVIQFFLVLKWCFLLKHPRIYIFSAYSLSCCAVIDSSMTFLFNSLSIILTCTLKIALNLKGFIFWYQALIAQLFEFMGINLMKWKFDNFWQ